MEDILRKCFDFRTPSESLVVEKLFANIEVKSSDAAFSVRLSDADLKYNVGRGVPLAWFWCDSIIEIVENYCRERANKNPRDHEVSLLIQHVIEFLNDEDNLQHLKKVRSAKNEAEIQAILAHHLFGLLAPSAEYLIDRIYNWPTDLKKCPACNKELNLGNTSIGNHRVWYGFPDIIIDKTTIKVLKDPDESVDDEEAQDYEWEEPAAKRLKFQNAPKPRNDTVGRGESSEVIPDERTTFIEVKTDVGFASEKNLQQIFAQTIVNAFYQSKQNPKLKDLYIPSFLVSDVKLKILMYNYKQDRLFMSVNMTLWNEDGSLNVGTLICTWLALNFENFQNHVKEKDFEEVGLKKSSFQAKLPDDILLIYQDELSRQLPLKKKRIEEPPPLTVFDLPSSRYAQNVVDRLKKMANSYFT